MPDKLNLAVLISGGGSNLQALIDACAAPDFPARIQLVISNRPDAYGIERAKIANIDTKIIDHNKYTKRIEFEKRVQNALSNYPIDLICLAGFMRILTADFINHWPKKIINTHPALLPKFGGKGMYGEHVHRAVLEAGETESGASIHYVIPEVDQGPVISQAKVPVLAADTINTLSTRVIEQEHKLYPEAVKKIASERRP
ncbi:MAG: phosphoribosylglycinamide formyltransferase [Micavibrio sp.]|nr:phosphoribosylglycinamide formyltransferase [Micavibrio sp.]